VNKDGSSCFVVLGLGGARGLDGRGSGALHLVAEFDEGEELTGTCRCTEVGPGGVVDLCDFAYGRERMGGMRERELADDGVRWFGCWLGGSGSIVGVCDGSSSTSIASFGWSAVFLEIKRDLLLREVLKLEGSVILGRPIGVAFELTPFLFSGEHNYNSHVLIPDNAPEIL
jgi:hypothetical protein